MPDHCVAERMIELGRLLDTCSFNCPQCFGWESSARFRNHLNLEFVAGDLLQRWSNNTFKSALHRVVSKTPGKDRLSCACFVSPRYDAQVTWPFFFLQDLPTPRA